MSFRRNLNIGEEIIAKKFKLRSLRDDKLYGYFSVLNLLTDTLALKKKVDEKDIVESGIKLLKKFTR
ncbi:hypothetical protein RM51_11205 [Chryseobacterium taiwanense]|uniref:Uncharacterized protein n=1 Tax=Chryseobacterium taiwanense TaxID=363331 RepID=A0A0B4D7U5_9FLAO|nr:hypothetical protein RM51_11205 [Chryseobacterium taiwanense]